MCRLIYSQKRKMAAAVLKANLLKMSVELTIDGDASAAEGRRFWEYSDRTLAFSIVMLQVRKAAIKRLPAESVT
jgi:hypothetical protein